MSIPETISKELMEKRIVNAYSLVKTFKLRCEISGYLFTVDDSEDLHTHENIILEEDEILLKHPKGGVELLFSSDPDKDNGLYVTTETFWKNCYLSTATFYQPISSDFFLNKFVSYEGDEPIINF